MLRVVRRMIPWQSPDVSPFERPLTTRELRHFAREFSWERHRHFLLAGFNLVAPIASHRRCYDPWHVPLRRHLLFQPAQAASLVDNTNPERCPRA